MFDESDEEEWSNYYYSLADYMWKHGILTEAIRHQVITMIDSDFGLEIWEEEGAKILGKRKKALAEFRDMLLSPQPPKKKIKVNLFLSPIFETGDVIAIQLQTKDKRYIPNSNFSEQFFRESDGKYVVIRKVTDLISFSSSVEPRVKDHWAVFQLYRQIFEAVPSLTELENIPWADPMKKKTKRPPVKHIYK